RSRKEKEGAIGTGVAGGDPAADPENAAERGSAVEAVATALEQRGRLRADELKAIMEEALREPRRSRGCPGKAGGETWRRETGQCCSRRWWRSPRTHVSGSPSSRRWS